MAVKASKPAEFHSARIVSAQLQPRLVAILQVMVSHIGRVTDNEIEARRRIFFGEVGEPHHKTGFCPELRGWFLIVWVYVESERFEDTVSWKDVTKRRVKCTSSNCWIEKAYFLVCTKDGCRIL